MSSETFDAADIRPFVAPLLRYKWLIVTFVLSATLSSLAFTFIVAERYRAETTILYQPRQQVSFRPKTRDALGFPPPLVPLESIGNTLQEVLTSTGLLEQTVRTLRLDQKEVREHTSWFSQAFSDAKDRVKEWRSNVVEVLKYGRVLPKDPFLQAMLTLRDNVAIKRTAKAYTFELEALHQNPETAARIVNTMGALLAEFLAAEQTRSASEARERIEPRLQQSRQEIAQLRSAVESFKMAAGVSSLSEELSLKLTAINGLEQQQTTVANDLRSLENRRKELTAQLDAQAPSVKYQSTTEDNPVVEQMRLDLARLEVQRSGLLEKFTSSHHDVRAVDAQMEQVRRKLDQEVATIVSSESTRVNDIHQKLLADLLETEAEIETLGAKRQALASSLAEHHAVVRRLTEKEPELADLMLKLNAAEQAYDLIHEAYEESRLGESKSASEVAVLHEALVPVAPARPIKIVHVGTSLLLSLILALGCALFSRFFDSRLRTIDDAERTLGIPVLATIPEVAPKRVMALVGRSAS